MTLHRLTTTCLAGVLIVLIGTAPVSAQSSNEPKLYKAYYLEHEVKDFAAAKKLYDKVIDADVSSEVRQIARTGSDRCRDHLAAEDFTVLMPPDALAYIEITRPGQIVEKLAEMLGIAGKDMQKVLAQRPNDEANIQINDAPPFHIPSEIMISPAIFEVLNSFGGFAVAITDFDPQEDAPPSGVMVLHHGDVALLKGLLETGFQFAPTIEKIKDMPTFGFQLPEVGNVTGVLTESLFIVGTGRDLVEGVVNRLTGADTTSLATREDLEEVASQREGSTLFGYVDLQAMIKIAKANLDEHDQREFAMANTLADLDSLRWATFSAGINDGTLGFQFAVRLADDHHSLVYNLMRLPPMTRNCLEVVPPNAAAFFALGLNPALTSMAIDTAKGGNADTAVTGFDIGREFFGNIQELCVFVVPGKMIKPDSPSGPPVIPNIGVVMAVNNPAKSKALWDQLLALPGLFTDGEPIPPKTVTIGKQEVTAFAIPEFGKIYVAELDGCLAMGATRNAMKATIRTQNKAKSIIDDEVMSKIIADMPKDSSVMVVAHIGRLAKVAAGSGHPAVTMGATQAADLLSDMVLWAGIGQSPNQMTLQTAIRGLPNLNVALKKYGPMLKGFAGLAASSEKGSKGSSSKAPSFNDLTSKGIAAAKKGDYETALKHHLKAGEIADIGLANYNIACVYSLLEKNDKAFEYLFRAIEQGMGDTGHDIVDLMKTDSDFDSIRDDPRWEKALATAKAKTAGSEEDDEGDDDNDND